MDMVITQHSRKLCYIVLIKYSLHREKFQIQVDLNDTFSGYVSCHVVYTIFER
jgi:hypothetical protein